MAADLAGSRYARAAGTALAPLLALLACARPQPEAPALARTRSPHGDADIACASCHQAAAWSPLREDVSFDHARETSFALTGGHARVNCRGCHLDLRFDQPKIAAGDCAICHVDVHASRLGVDCASCHDTRSFAPSGRRDAHQGTAFPLTGRHRQVACEACHGSATEQHFEPLPSNCASCHAAEYRAAIPNHDAPAFRADCASCHGSVAWSGARFDHLRQTGFVLEGTHVRVDCQSCHAPPDFAVRFTAAGPRDCIACHRADYDRAHPTLGFSDNCLTCHSLQSFRVERWPEHDARFPIYIGAHSRKWTSCAQCHEGRNFVTVTCLTCHEHSQTKMDDKHRGRAGYSYTTAACLDCHPSGRKE